MDCKLASKRLHFCTLNHRRQQSLENIQNMGASGPNRLPLLLAAFGVLLLIATLFHQFNGVPESWRTSFSGDGGDRHHGSDRWVLSAGPDDAEADFVLQPYCLKAIVL